jgi:hypothetical protein
MRSLDEVEKLHTRRQVAAAPTAAHMHAASVAAVMSVANRI